MIKCHERLKQSNPTGYSPENELRPNPRLNFCSSYNDYKNQQRMMSAIYIGKMKEAKWIWGMQNRFYS